MDGFRPTVASPGRLLRLGVVLNSRHRPERLREVARMCDGAGIESLWVRDAGRGSTPAGLEAWTAITLAATDTRRPAIGAVVAVGARPAQTMAAMASTLDAASGGRLELTFTDLPERVSSRSERSDHGELERYTGAVRGLLEQGGAGPRLSVEVADEGGMDAAARVADDAVLHSGLGRDPAAALVQVRRACERRGRDPVTMGVALEVPVSIGRTTAEARARAAAEPLFDQTGQPAEVGVFGTLEQCQERVIQLAHLGVTDLRCHLPNSPDIHDVIAQLTAMAIGSMEVLSPNAPRSKPPDPPQTWGGRAVKDVP